jgi:hypothetical protein
MQRQTHCYHKGDAYQGDQEDDHQDTGVKLVQNLGYAGQFSPVAAVALFLVGLTVTMKRTSAAPTRETRKMTSRKMKKCPPWLLALRPEKK